MRHSCPLSAMTYPQPGDVLPRAVCSACGLVWPLTTRDGRAVGYLTPPYKPAERAERMKGWWE